MVVFCKSLDGTFSTFKVVNHMPIIIIIINYPRIGPWAKGEASLVSSQYTPLAL